MWGRKTVARWLPPITLCVKIRQSNDTKLIVMADIPGCRVNRDATGELREKHGSLQQADAEGSFFPSAHCLPNACSRLIFS
jgi:hypothetical protein